MWHIDVFSSEMGGSNSKQNNVETSSGFHFVEIHGHTMGVSIITVVVVLAIVALAYSCASKLCKKYLLRPRNDQNVLPIYHQPYPPFFNPEAYYPYFGMAMANRNVPMASITELPATAMVAPPNRRRQHRLATAEDAPVQPPTGANAKKQSAAAMAASEWANEG